MEQPPTWAEWLYVGAGAALLLAAMVFWAIGNYLPIKPKTGKFNWQPDLEPTPEVHILGSDYPQRNGTFLRHLVNRPYTVPKDPEAYVKIFVPTKDRKGSDQ